MTATLGEMADEIAAKLRAMIAAASEEIDVWPRLNLHPQGFCIDVYPSDPFRTPVTAGFGEPHGQVDWVVRARISGDRDAEQDLLLALMDEESAVSVATALEDDQTLNGLAGSVYVGDPSGYRAFIDGAGDGQARLGVQWIVTVLRAYS